MIKCAWSALRAACSIDQTHLIKVYGRQCVDSTHLIKGAGDVSLGGRRTPLSWLGSGLSKVRAGGQPTCTTGVGPSRLIRRFVGPGRRRRATDRATANP